MTENVESLLLEHMKRFQATLERSSVSRTSMFGRLANLEGAMKHSERRLELTHCPPGPRQTGARLQREAAREGGRQRRRSRQRQDEHEPLRRDRRRGSHPPEGKGRATEIVAVSIGPAKAQETLRTALAMGADRAILVTTDDGGEPLAVAKLLAKVVEEEQPGLVILGKQAIDDDSNQVGQMLAALLGWGAGHLRLQGRGGRRAASTSPARSTAAWRRCGSTLPAIVTTDLRLNEPRYATLPNIMKAKSKPLAQKTPADYGVDTAPRLTVLKVTEPAKRQAGVKVGSVDELIDKIKETGVIG
jgi:electron transfer flavoprotein beta subunit